MRPRVLALYLTTCRGGPYPASARSGLLLWIFRVTLSTLYLDMNGRLLCKETTVVISPHAATVYFMAQVFVREKTCFCRIV